MVIDRSESAEGTVTGSEGASQSGINLSWQNTPKYLNPWLLSDMCEFSYDAVVLSSVSKSITPSFGTNGCRRPSSAGAFCCAQSRQGPRNEPTHKREPPARHRHLVSNPDQGTQPPYGGRPAAVRAALYVPERTPIDAGQKSSLRDLARIRNEKPRRIQQST